MQSQVGGLETGLGSLRSSIPAAPNLTPLQQQIAALQSQVSNIPSVNLSPLESRLGGLESRISGINIPSLDPVMAQLAQLEARIAAIPITNTPTYTNPFGGGSYFRRGGVVPRMRSGGLPPVGQYAAGGKLLTGPGDGMSDDIVANIEGRQEARLADGEFVVPADVVSHLGNGSTKAGANKLYTMMDKVRKARTGNPRQGREINAYNFLPA